MIINKEALDVLFTGFKSSFQEGLAGAPSTYKSIAMTVPSTHSAEQYSWLGQIPAMREWVGDRVISGLKGHNYTVQNKDYEDTISVPRNDIMDDQYGVFGKLFEQLGRAAAEQPDKMCYDLLSKGHETPCYDGQNFFDADHPVETENSVTSVSNVAPIDIGGGEVEFEPWYLLDCTRAMKPLLFQERLPFDKLTKLDQDSDPNVFMRKEYIYGVEGRGNVGFGLWQLAYRSTKELTPANYEAARKHMMTMRGDENRVLGITPNVLVCSPNLEGKARKIL
ncbi:MAG: Mu-like prophage major head subunit gpT family protein, partial [Pseudomonadota bacterium]